MRLLGRLLRQAAREGLVCGAGEATQGPQEELPHHPADQHDPVHIPAGRGQLPLHVYPGQVRLGGQLVQQLQDLQVIGLCDCHAAGCAADEQGFEVEGYGGFQIYLVETLKYFQS